MYLVDFGVLNSFPEQRRALENTGVVWKVTRTAPIGGVDAGFGGAATSGVEAGAGSITGPASLAAFAAAALLAGGLGWRLNRRRSTH
jgi:hypothetical protein